MKKNFIKKSAAVVMAGLIATTSFAVPTFAGIPATNETVQTLSISDNTFHTASSKVVKSGVDGNITWKLYSTGTLTISGNGEMKNYMSGMKNAPWYSYKSKITKVIIKNGVTYIGDQAFYMFKKLKSVQIASSVKEIGYASFEFCTKLKTVKFSKGLKIIGDAAFCDDPIVELILPDSVTTIEQGAFSHCGKLKKLHLSENLQKIGGSAFKECDSLTTIVIPSNVTNIGYSAFEGSSNVSVLKIKTKKLKDNYTSVCTGAFCVSIGKKITCYIPKSKFKLYKKILLSRGISKYNSTFKAF